jgi:hypothetical protein
VYKHEDYLECWSRRGVEDGWQMTPLIAEIAEIAEVHSPYFFPSVIDISYFPFSLPSFIKNNP